MAFKVLDAFRRKSQPNNDIDEQEQLFSPVSEVDEMKDTLLPTSSRHRLRTRTRPSSIVSVICYYSLRLYAILTTATVLYLLYTKASPHLDALCTTHTTAGYSPITSSLPIHYSTQIFNGSFLEPSIYRQSPSDSVDEAWSSLGTDFGLVIIPPTHAESASLDPLRHIQLPENHPKGPGFVANVEVFHQLHCLNLLRQSLFFNAPYYFEKRRGPFGDRPEMLGLHVTHCVDILRQQLMCNGDLGLVPYLIPPEAEKGDMEHVHDAEAHGNASHGHGAPGKPMPDFYRPHRCRNFEGIRQLVEDTQVVL